MPPGARREPAFLVEVAAPVAEETTLDTSLARLLVIELMMPVPEVVPVGVVVPVVEATEPDLVVEGVDEEPPVEVAAPVELEMCDRVKVAVLRENVVVA